MKKQLIVMLVMMMTSTMIFAQRMHNKWKDGASQADKMKTELSLTDQQYASIKTINEKYKNKFVTLRSDSAVTREVKAKQMKDLKAERKKEVDKVLTPAQQTKWQAYKKEQRAAKKAQHEKREAAHYAKLKTDLSLTDDQLAKLKATNESFKEKHQQIRKSNADKSEMKKLGAEHEAAVKSILNADQFEKWKAQKEMRKEKAKEHRKKHSRN